MTPFISIYMNNNIFIKKTGAEYISSRQNPRVMLFSSLREQKNREAERLFLAEGVKLSKEACEYAEVAEILVSESYLGGIKEDDFIFSLSENGTKVTLLSDSAFGKISTEKSPQGVISVVKYIHDKHVFSDFESWQKNKRIIMLDEIRDPGNLGTIIRSAEALGIDGIVLNGCADIYNNKTVRAAMGALYRMPIFISDNAVETVIAMKKSGRRVIGATLGKNTVTLGEYETKKSDCIIIGNEGHGISEEIVAECDLCVKIPMSGLTESLNASAAAVCIMWEYFRSN